MDDTVHQVFYCRGALDACVRMLTVVSDACKKPTRPAEVLWSIVLNWLPLLSCGWISWQQLFYL